MDKQTSEYSPEFRQFLQQVGTALIKSSAEARRIAEQTGTRLIISEDFEVEDAAEPTGNNVGPDRDEMSSMNKG